MGDRPSIPWASWRRRLPSWRGVRPAVRATLATLGVLALTYAGYWLAHAIYFVGLPLEDLSRAEGDVAPQVFRYDGVVCFDGHRLADGQALELRSYAPRALTTQRHAELEIFVRVPGMPDAPRVVNGPPAPHDPAAVAAPLGVLRVRAESRGDADGVAADLVLDHRTFQRFRVPYRAAQSRNNRLSFSLALVPGAAAADGAPVAIELATNLHAPGIFVGAVRWGAIAAVLLAGAALLGPRPDWRLQAMLATTVATCWFFQSGGFTSNAYFDGDENRIAAMAGQLDKLLEDGSFADTVYREGGTLVVPATWLLLEQSRGVLKGDAPERLPGIRYLTWAWFAVAFGVLQAALFRRYGAAVPLVAGLLYATHAHTYEYGLFKIDADAFMFPWTMLIAASVLRMASATTSLRWWIHGAWIATCMVGLGALKITPIILVGLVPAALWLDALVRERRIRQWRPAILALVMLAALVVGGRLGALPQSPNRNVGLPGHAFQDTLLWHVLWAANGHFDDGSAHWFTKNGPLRNERVAEQLGLPPVTYLRQSQAATDAVYKPQVLRALRERPGFFVGNMAHRALGYSLHFYRSTSQQHHAEWRATHARETMMVDGVETPGADAAAALSRFGRFWKIAPTYLVAEITDRTIGLGTDLVLVGLSLLGVVLLRRADVLVLFLGLAAAKFSAGTLLHETNRYFAFAHVFMLVGLAACLVAAARCLLAQRLERPAPTGTATATAPPAPPASADARD